MRRVHFKGFLLGTLLSVTTLAAKADNWAGPQTEGSVQRIARIFRRGDSGRKV